jgi:hypothetical protein
MYGKNFTLNVQSGHFQVAVAQNFAVDVLGLFTVAICTKIKQIHVRHLLERIIHLYQTLYTKKLILFLIQIHCLA